MQWVVHQQLYQTEGGQLSLPSHFDTHFPNSSPDQTKRHAEAKRKKVEKEERSVRAKSIHPSALQELVLCSSLHPPSIASHPINLSHLRPVSS
jgi:hypothetical protein